MVYPVFLILHSTVQSTDKNQNPICNQQGSGDIHDKSDKKHFGERNAFNPAKSQTVHTRCDRAHKGTGAGKRDNDQYFQSGKTQGLRQRKGRYKKAELNSRIAEHLCRKGGRQGNQKNNVNTDKSVETIEPAQPAKNSWIPKAYKIAASTTAMPTKINPLVGSSL